MHIGTTFSHRHSRHLRLDPKRAFEELVEAGFQTIRIACYWEEIEKEKGTYDFSLLHELLEIAEKKRQRIVLIVGMKGPRFPEFFFPRWLEERSPEGAEEYIYPFILASVTSLQRYTCITHWQVENEPFFKSGRIHREIPTRIVEKEINIVRGADTRPIVITLWGNDYRLSNHFKTVERMADVIGLDIYFKVPVIGPLYRGPWSSDRTLTRLIQQSEKPVWITELQAEPWERRYIFKNATTTPSLDPVLMHENFTRVASSGVAAVFLWGAEYWLMKKQRGDLALWQAAKEIVGEHSV